MFKMGSENNTFSRKMRGNLTFLEEYSSTEILSRGNDQEEVLFRERNEA